MQKCLNTGLIIGVSVAAFVVVLVIAVLVCIGYKRGWCLKVRGCHKFSEIAASYNVISAGTLSVEEFKAIKDKIIQNINLSSEISNYKDRI